MNCNNTFVLKNKRFALDLLDERLHQVFRLAFTLKSISFVSGE